MAEEVAVYRVEQLPQVSREGRWGVFNVGASRFIDVTFSSEAEATRAASWLKRLGSR